MAGAVLLLLISGIGSHEVFHEVEWRTIFFFIGLFIIVGGLRETGVINAMATQVFNITKGDLFITTMAVLWVSAIGSAFVDNIPFVTTMIPLIKQLGVMSGINIFPLWWALSLGACLGGNGTIIGASANVIAAGLSDHYGHKITFGGFFKVCFPVMLLTILLSTVYIYFMYLR
jgi:Na+/H+ antiporter NhaD/arsenite permease-like protein